MTGSSTWTSALALINLKTGTSVTPSGASYSASGPSVTYSFSTPLADGNYAAILKSPAITNGLGVPLAGNDHVAGDDYVYSFYFLKGDLTLNDRTVSTTDVSTASSHSGSAGTYSDGDVDYSGTVDSADVSFMTGASGTTLPLLGSAETPTVSASDTSSITIAWGASSDTSVTNYDVYRDYARIAQGISGTSFDDTGLATGSTHVYFVVARDDNGNTSYVTPDLRASATPSAPSAPSDFLNVQSTGNSVLLAWADSDPNVVSYNVYRSDPSHSLALVASNIAATAYYDAGLDPSTTYSYQVEAVTASGAVSSTRGSASVAIAGSGNASRWVWRDNPFSAHRRSPAVRSRATGQSR